MHCLRTVLRLIMRAIRPLEGNTWILPLAAVLPTKLALQHAQQSCASCPVWMQSLPRPNLEGLEKTRAMVLYLCNGL